MLLLERDFRIPSEAQKKAYLIDKKASPELIREVIAKAGEERANGVSVNISMMKKNKKFQKEQLQAEGYTEIEEFFQN
jgi:histidyl-tRNA synthetase